MIIERTIKFYLRHRGENSTDNLRVIMRVTIKNLFKFYFKTCV